MSFSIQMEKIRKLFKDNKHLINHFGLPNASINSFIKGNNNLSNSNLEKICNKLGYKLSIVLVPNKVVKSPELTKLISYQDTLFDNIKILSTEVKDIEEKKELEVRKNRKSSPKKVGILTEETQQKTISTVSIDLDLEI